MISQRARARPWLAVFAVSAAAILVLVSTLGDYFLSDDFGLIRLYADKPLPYFLTLFVTPWTEGIYGYRPDEIRPFVALAYRIDAVWGAASPFGYHVGNIALHVATALLVLALARLLVGLGWPAATFAGVAFAVMPVHAEVGAWTSGMADSIPAACYLGTLLAFGLWRQSSDSKSVFPPLPNPPPPRGRGRIAVLARRLAPRRRMLLLFIASLSFVGALFSKQSAITMLATLVAYDVLMERRLPWAPWRTLLGYVPFALLTAGYLGLRIVLFGNVAREQLVTANTLVSFAAVQATFVSMVATGAPQLRPGPIWVAPTLIGLLAAGAGVVWALPSILRGRPASRLGAVAFFGPAWWLITVAPLAMTYVSARHLYLTTAGWAVLLGMAFGTLWDWRGMIGRGLAIGSGAGVLLFYALTLHGAVAEWNAAGDLSYRMAVDLWRSAADAPAGSLVVFNAPATNIEIPIWFGSPAFALSDEPGPIEASAVAPTLIWAWATPFLYGPPFAPPGLETHVSIVGPPGVFCCPGDQWLRQTQSTIAAWQAQPERSSIVVVQWDDVTGELHLQAGDARSQQTLERISSAQSPDEASTLFQELFLPASQLEAP